MRNIDFYLDFISPYAYLAFERHLEALAGLDYRINYKPVLFAGLLKHHGQLGPAEIPDKRDWTFRHVQWMAYVNAIELQTPAAHPFNPLPLLRLAIASSSQGQPDHAVCAAIFHHVWRGGLDATDPDRLSELLKAIQPIRKPADENVKVQLKHNTEEAISRNVFGVPSFLIEGKNFWGLDSLPMLRSYIEGDSWFESTAWNAAGQIPIGVSRK